MSKPTHVIRFIAEEDHREHIGQLVDSSQDVGLAILEGRKVEAYWINGTIFDGEVMGKEHILTVKQLLSPISREQCNYVRCLGLNYVDHAEASQSTAHCRFILQDCCDLISHKALHCVPIRADTLLLLHQESKMTLPAAPILFTKPRTALASPYPSPISIPRVAQDGTSDYEAELCVVIGKTGRNIPESRALEYVLGYTCANDVSARTAQMATTQWCFSKGLDESCPLGPVLVMRAAVGDPNAEKGWGIKTVLDGQVVQDGNTSQMVFSIKQTIAYLSQGTTLEAGTVILTGTPDGIGYFREPRLSLKDGGDVRVWIENIGTLVNKVKYEAF